jgi:guanosine-3',5'-bis(diphosphate) 3'-pyrophosphohydrolase
LYFGKRFISERFPFFKMEQSILERVAEFADHAHGEQRRKYSGERYIVHPIRVMKICQSFHDQLAIHAAALLHDVLEDTPVTQREMLTFLNSVMSADLAASTLRLVVELTDVYTKRAFPALKRLARKELEFKRLSLVSSEAQTIKYADVLDNTKDIIVSDPDFATIYLCESGQLLKQMNRGNQVLYRQVVSLVEEGQLFFSRDK